MEDNSMNETYKKFSEGLEELIEQRPDTKPTKSALAKFLNLNASYLKTDGSIQWHLEIINRCTIATEEYQREKDIKDKRKKQRNKSEHLKLKEKVDSLQEEVKQLTSQLNESREIELHLFNEWNQTKKELDNMKKNSMGAIAINNLQNDWRD